MFFGQVIEAQPDMPVVGAVTLYVSLLTFTLRVHPDRLDYVDQVLVIFFRQSYDLCFPLTVCLLTL
jgi:hypothetical protein